VSAPSRNEPCPCGSGKRYKECHGKAGDAAVAGAPPDAREKCRQLMIEALAHQQARRLVDAEQLYRAALALAPDEPDALHMLGVIRYERGDLAEARDLIVRALDLTGWRITAIRQNLGLVLSKQNATSEIAGLNALRSRYAEFLEARRARRRPANPRVSVVIPAYNHAQYVERALRSIFEQTYRGIDIVAIDDGSQDATATVIRDCLRDSPFPHQFVARGNRGAPATLNEGRALAHGDYVQFLNSDDWFHPDRVARMVAEVTDTGSNWGFSAVAIHGEDGTPVDPVRNRRAFDITCSIAKIPFRTTVGRALLTENVVVSTGNLFAARALCERLGDFREFRYNHDWDWCLRALQVDEPVFVAERLYCYRLHGANTISEPAGQVRAEALRVCSDYLAWARSVAHPSNPFAPAASTWGLSFTQAILKGGMGGVLDADSLRQLALAGQ
jgi:GT2 family glycosyltransferase